MKGSRNLLKGIFLGGLITGTLFVLGMPFISELTSFVLGIIACLLFVSLSFLLVMALNKMSLRKALSGNHAALDKSESETRTKASTWILLASIMIAGGLVSGFIIYKQFELSKAMAAHQRSCDTQHSELLESIRKSGLSSMLSNVLDKIDKELENNPKRILSDATIARITALSSYLLPDNFNYVEADSMVVNYSQERGQLLLVLSRLNLDSVSFSKIKLNTSFARADLSGADLRGINLSGANMATANFRDADLTDSNLKQADLKGANFWGSNLSRADLSTSAMNRADLRWTDLTDADLRGAVLDGILLTGSKLRKADLSDAIIRYADMSGALFEGANLSRAVMFATDLSASDLSGAVLNKADLRACNLSDANLNDADLSNVLLRNTGVREEDWLEKLDLWRVKGAKEIQEHSQVAHDFSGRAIYAITKVVE